MLTGGFFYRPLRRKKGHCQQFRRCHILVCTPVLHLDLQPFITQCWPTLSVIDAVTDAVEFTVIYSQAVCTQTVYMRKICHG